MSKKVKIIIGIVLLLVVIEVGVIVVLKMNPKTGIESVSNEYTNYTVKFKPLKSIKEYTFHLFKNDETLIEEEISGDSYNFELKDYSYEDNYKIEITYVSKKGDTSTLGEAYEFKWEEPKFNEENKIIIDKGYIIKIDGEPSKKDYKIDFYKDSDLVVSDKLDNKEYKINNKVFDNSGTYTAIIKYNDIELDSKVFYYDVNPIGDIKITNMKDDDYVDASSFKVEYTGGENATAFYVKFEQDNKEIKKEKLNDDNTVDLTGIDINKPYKITLIAELEHLEKTSSVNIWLLSKLRAGMVNTAIAELGNEGGKKFWSWYANWGRFEWCACFLSWVAEQNGIMDVKIPKFIGVGIGADWFKRKNQYKYRKDYTPLPGDIIFIDWDPNNRLDHVGMVLKVEDGKVWTIEGNRKSKTERIDAVRIQAYDLNSKFITAYGTPSYEE